MRVEHYVCPLRLLSFPRRYALDGLAPPTGDCALGGSTRVQFTHGVQRREAVHLVVPINFHPIAQDIQLYPLQRTQRVESFSAHGALALHRSVNGKGK
jgi:hypothetical protein